MKQVRIDFVDFWDNFEIEDFYIYDILKEKYEVIIDSKNPDYIFYSCFGYKHLKYDCIKIFYTGENIRPDFNICDYAIGFDYLNFEDRYLRYPLYLMLNKYLLNLKKANSMKKKNIGKKKFCNMVVSNPLGSVRNEFYKKLSQYKIVDSGGKYLNNIAGPIEDKISFQSKYKFSMAFENSKANGYCTEKIVDAYCAGTIPIYYGDNTIDTVFNPKSFIWIKDISDIDEVIELIKKIDNDDKIYSSYLNANILNDKNYIEKEQKKLKQFIYNIFDKEIINARRCIKDQWTYMYQVQRLEGMRLYNKFIFKSFRKIKKIFKITK